MESATSNDEYDINSMPKHSLSEASISTEGTCNNMVDLVATDQSLKEEETKIDDECILNLHNRASSCDSYAQTSRRPIEVIEGNSAHQSSANSEATGVVDLIVAPSWINRQFLGLFANRPFKEGEVVCRYFGTVLRTKEALQVADKSYLMRLGEQSYVDSRECLECQARYINDCRNPCGYNVVFRKIPSEQCAMVVALRNIGIGEELFVDYGKWYWAGCSIVPSRLSFAQLNELRGVLQ